MSDYYTVVRGDTLSKIAKANGTTARELTKLNQIKNPNRLDIGQRLALKKEVVLGVQPLFLDHNRDPIKGLEYAFEFAGKVIKGITPENGLGKQIFTETATDEVRILIKRLDGTLKDVGKVVSGYGNKLVTLISPSVKVEAKTEKHPELKPGEYPDPKDSTKPAFDPKTKQSPTSDKKDLGLKPKATTTPDGKPIVVVTGDIPDLSFLDEYNGEVMTEADYEWAAKELDVEKAAIKAFAVVESGESGFLKIGKRQVPKILYERHKFSSRTNHQYSAKYPDISLPTAYYNSKAKYVLADSDFKKEHGVPNDVEYYRTIRNKDSKEIKENSETLNKLLEEGKATEEKDKYASGLGSYKRLLKAYQLDKNAALESCSWGMFQIMGLYWKTMKYSSVTDFVKAVSRSPKEQIKAFVLYIKYVNPKIKTHLESLDWAAVAEAYNGKSYKDNNYDVKLEAAYKKFKE